MHLAILLDNTSDDYIFYSAPLYFCRHFVALKLLMAKRRLIQPLLNISPLKMQNKSSQKKGTSKKKPFGNAVATFYPCGSMLRFGAICLKLTVEQKYWNVIAPRTRHDGNDQSLRKYDQLINWFNSIDLHAKNDPNLMDEVSFARKTIRYGKGLDKHKNLKIRKGRFNWITRELRKEIKKKCENPLDSADLRLFSAVIGTRFFGKPRRRLSFDFFQRMISSANMSATEIELLTESYTLEIYSDLSYYILKSKLSFDTLFKIQGIIFEHIHN